MQFRRCYGDRPPPIGPPVGPPRPPPDQEPPAQLAAPHNLDGRDRSRPSPLQIPRHSEHFQHALDVPHIPQEKTPDGKTIIGWECFLLEMHPTHLFCPVVLVDGEEIANSKVLFCCDCAKWVHYGGTVTHYRDHARRHEDYAERCRGLSNPDGPAVHFVSFIFQTGAPLRAMETLRNAWVGEDFPNRQHLSQIMQMVKARVKEAIRIECAAAAFVNIALDGWTDPDKRTFEGITIRTVQFDGSTSVYLAALKPVPASEDAAVLDRYLQSVIRRYNLQGKVLSICTDRGSANRKAFSTNPPVADFFSHVWMPCCCHVLNNFLRTFMGEIKRLTAPIFRLSGAFRTETHFRRYLASVKAPFTVIPTYTEIRWSSAHEMFRALVALWPHMVNFVELTHMSAPDLTPEVFETVKALERVFAKFVRAQTRLESDSFGTGSAFAGHLISIKDHIQRFKTQFGVRTTVFEAYVKFYLTDLPRQWLVLVLQTFLNPTLKFGDPDSPFTQKTREEALNLLTALVDAEINRARVRAAEEAHAREEADARARERGQAELDEEEPSSDTYLTNRPSDGSQWVAAERQVSTYLGARDTGLYDLDIWGPVNPDMVELRIVALKVLSILTTSSSAERAFSLAALLCGDYQMAMSALTLSTRMIAQANWSLAAPYIPTVLNLGPRGWNSWEQAYFAAKRKYIPRPPVPPPDSSRSRSEGMNAYLLELAFSSSDDDEAPPTFKARRVKSSRRPASRDSEDEDVEDPRRRRRNPSRGDRSERFRKSRDDDSDSSDGDSRRHRSPHRLMKGGSDGDECPPRRERRWKVRQDVPAVEIPVIDSELTQPELEHAQD
jgi:hypothetical protein